ncbi:MAG: phosphoribosylanthranilate isomerase [Planctomycetota bacterium]|jgi:phosphoribosylanthranilate isomerase
MNTSSNNAGIDFQRCVKVCGLTSERDTQLALQAGADLFGAIAEPTSSARAFSAEEIRSLLAAAPLARRVLVTTETDPVKVSDAASQARVGLVQLCGPCRGKDFIDFPFPILRALAVDREDEFAEWDAIATAFVLEPCGSVGGSGRAIDTERARDLAARRPCLIAGGLDAGNVSERVMATGRVGVDASSALELETGRKDSERVRVFVTAARSAMHAQQQKSASCS